MKSKGITINVLTYNIHKGFSAGNRRYVLSEIKSAIRSVGADIVFLQEVFGDHNHPRGKLKNWPNNAQFEYLADEIWNHFAYGRNATFSDRHHGNAILSKYPIVFWENIDVTIRPMERRGILHGVIRIPKIDQDVHVICIHFDLTERGRMAQIKRLCKRVSEHVPEDAPLILGGDFNDWRRLATPILQKELGLEEAFVKMKGHHVRTFPSFLPTLCLDRIYFRGLKVKAAKRLLDSPWKQLSDHAAVTASLELPL